MQAAAVILFFGKRTLQERDRGNVSEPAKHGACGHPDTRRLVAQGLDQRIENPLRVLLTELLETEEERTQERPAYTSCGLSPIGYAGMVSRFDLLDLLLLAAFGEN